MEHPSRILIAVCILLIAGITFSGCSDSSDSGDSTTPASTAAKYSEGDIVQMASGSSTTGYLIIGYDSATDMYTRALIRKNSNGAWGYRSNADTSTIGRTEFESLFTVTAGHVTVASIPTRAPTIVVTTLPTTKVTTVRTTATTTTSTTAKPIIRSIDPEEGTAGDSVDMTITGSNFKSGAAVKLTKSGEDTITADDVSVDSSTQITCTFDIPSDTPTSVGWSVVVTNSDGKSGELANYFTVHEGDTSPSVTSISPTSKYQGDEEVKITITGTNFDDDCTVELVYSDDEYIEGYDISASSSTKLIAYFDIPYDATTGKWDIVVTNSDDASDTLSSAFTVKSG
jgi:hypothetical protein